MEVSIISILPFVLLLLSIAVLPLISHKWWEKIYPFISLGLALIILIYYTFLGKYTGILHSLEEYVMFISLIGSLFVISGGIVIDIKGSATPMRNVLFLLTGAVLSNFIGTTGASMLLIRPYIKSNKLRISAFHIVFFIFIVSNVGGSLTPIGDPPLFLGYLKGIPFFWITGRIIITWAFAIAALLIIFFIIDIRSFRKQPDVMEEKAIKEGEKIKIRGFHNFILLLVVICSVFITEPKFLREAVILLAAFISYRFTKKELHKHNHFNFHPVKEVGWLFLGIFITMMPALELLAVHSKSLGVTSPSQYYWFTGILSALLDNAPTYLAFLTASMGIYGLDINNITNVLEFIKQHESHVIAISVSAVFFGACTYIGNGPNFMVKSVADTQGVRMPGFIGYIIKYSLPILIPLYVLIWLLFIA